MYLRTNYFNTQAGLSRPRKRVSRVTEQFSAERSGIEENTGHFSRTFLVSMACWYAKHYFLPYLLINVQENASSEKEEWKVACFLVAPSLDRRAWINNCVSKWILLYCGRHSTLNCGIKLGQCCVTAWSIFFWHFLCQSKICRTKGRVVLQYFIHSQNYFSYTLYSSVNVFDKYSRSSSFKNESLSVNMLFYVYFLM